MNTTQNTNKVGVIKRGNMYESLINGDKKKIYIKKPNQRKVEIRTIIPEEARYILDKFNNNNRTDSEHMIKKISAEMQNGYWMNSGDAIQFDQNGQLVDGQHRLLACVHSNLAQEFIVVYGLNPEVIKVLDTGKQRSSADVLSMQGYGKDSSILAALSKAILSYKEIGTYQLNGHRALKGGKFVTNSKIVDFLENNENIGQFVQRYKKPMVTSKANMCFCYWLLSTVNQKKAENFLDKIFNGTQLREKTIEKTIHDKLIANRSATKKMNRTAIISLIVTGWRKYMGLDNSKSHHVSWKMEDGYPPVDGKWNKSK